MKQYYSTRTYDQEGGFHPKMVQLMVVLADLQTGHRCLDLCTRTGLVVERIRERIEPSGSIVAVEFSRSMLEVAAKKSHLTTLSCYATT